MNPLQAAAIAAVVAAFLLSGCQAAPPAQAAKPKPELGQECKFTIGQLKYTLESRFKDLKEIILSGKDKDNFLEAFNSAEPPTNFTAHRIHVFHSRLANINNGIDTTVLTMVDANDCIERNGEVRTEDIVNWLPIKV